MPHDIYLAVSTCPAKLADPNSLCLKNITKLRKDLEKYLTDCLEEGIRTGEFVTVPVKETANILLALIIGLMRQRSLKLEKIKGIRSSTIEFCRRSLVKK